jgi:hypothetical protein
MNQNDLDVILSSNTDEIINKLSISSFSLPTWSSLEKQYDPTKHSIFDTSIYPQKLDENGRDEFKRTAFALQQLATSRMAQVMFSNPVKRTYSYDKTKESLKEAEAIIEELYRTQNFIDSGNVERCKKLNAACQFVTIWYTVEKPNIVAEQETKFKLKHKTYSEFDGYTIYPITDDFGELIVLSVSYKDSTDVEHFEIYTRTNYFKYDKIDGWILNEVSKPINVFPCSYMNIKQPIWGGEAGTNLIEQLEEMESFQGLYIKKNSVPTYYIDYGELQEGSVKSDTKESSTDARKLISVGRNGKMVAVNWDGANEAIKDRFARIRNAFFEQVQMADTSFATMINANISADSKELLFSDSKAKAKDLGGEWEIFFYEELLIVKEFAKVMFPKYVKDFDFISIRSEVVPYSVRSKKEAAEFISVGGVGMSLETKIRELNLVDDIEKEIEDIQNESSANANML